MTFHPDRLETFLRLFDESSPRIRAFPGCRHLELLADFEHPNVLTTLSRWDDDEALQRYRASSMFRATWARSKPLFAAPPVARSHHIVRPDHGPTSA